MRRDTKREQLRESVMALINDDPRRGKALPSEREIAAAHGVSRMTARLVIEELADRGLVYRVPGQGTFVAGDPVTKSLGLTSFTEDMLARGMKPWSRILEAGVVPAGAAAGRDLRVSPADEVVRIRRVRLADDAPMCLESVDLPSHLVPGLLSHDLGGSLYDLLASQYNIEVARADQRMRATVTDTEESKLLGVPVVSPALLVERVSSDREGRPVERARSLYRADRYDFKVAVERRPSRR